MTGVLPAIVTRLLAMPVVFSAGSQLMFLSINKKMAEEKERLEIDSIEQWREWLSDNFEREDGVWLITCNEHSGEDYVQYDSLVDVALCFGWVDSIQRRVDNDRTKLYVSPIKKGMPWSAVNKSRVQRLMEDDYMMQPGLDKVEAAKKDDSWRLFDEIEKGIEPLDFKQALKNNAIAKKHWAKFPQQVKKISSGG
jgi:uncharacterized protein YdeI (YjbR/CyaY-like superfamily)